MSVCWLSCAIRVGENQETEVEAPLLPTNVKQATKAKGLEGIETVHRTCLKRSSEQAGLGNLILSLWLVSMNLLEHELVKSATGC